MLFVLAKISLTKTKMWYSLKAVRKSALLCSAFVSCAAIVFISMFLWKLHISVCESIHVCICNMCNWKPEVYGLNTFCCQNIRKKSVSYVRAYGMFHWNVQLLLCLGFFFCLLVYSLPSWCGRLCCCGPGGCFKRTRSLCLVCTERRWELNATNVTETCKSPRKGRGYELLH